MIRHFTNLHEYSAQELIRLIESASALKARPRTDNPLAGKSVALCFMNPSLRTQTSFEVAAAGLGAHPVTLNFGVGAWSLEAEDGVVMDGKASEHAKEAVQVLSSYCQAVALRSFPEGVDWEKDKKDPYLSAFRANATVPVINLETSLGHPCQALADLMTIKERMRPRGKNFLLTWAPHIKALPTSVPNSAAEIAAMAGMNVTIARPEGYDLDPEVMARVKAACAMNGSRLTVTADAASAYEGQHVVYAKSWGSLKDYGTPPPSDPAFRNAWRVTQEKMDLTKEAVFMHCLPVRRNLVVDDAVIDGPASVVIEQAENRLHTAKAILLHLMNASSTTENHIPAGTAAAGKE